MKVAMYKMKENKYLGDCFSFVFSLSEREIPESFTRPELIVFVKTEEAVWNSISTLGEWMTCPAFCNSARPLLRIGSECMFGMFGDSHCNCEEERITALDMIKENGSGVYIHLPQEAQGLGIFYKANELNLQVNGVLPNGEYIGPKTQSEAASLLAGKAIIDSRNYEIIVKALKQINLHNYEYDFMSRNPGKVKALSSCGIMIADMVDITTTINRENLGETLTKWITKEFCFTTDEAKQIISLLCSEEKLPARAEALVLEAASYYTSVDGRERLFRRNHLDDTTNRLLEDAILNYSNRIELSNFAATA